MFDPVMESVVILSLGNLSRRLTLGQGMYPSLLSDLFAARSFTSFDKPEQSSQCPSESFLGCCFAVGYASRYCLQQGVSGDFLPISEKASQLASDPPFLSYGQYHCPSTFPSCFGRNFRADFGDSLGS